MAQSGMTDKHPDCFGRLRTVYASMDEAYNAVAAKYGFTCDQCPDNCCRTRFYNHTYLEYYFLLDGIGRLPADRRQQIVEAARTVTEQTAADESAGRTPRRLCPLNDKGLCGLHGHRLMICRLHGVPHELCMPDGRKSYGPGCPVFSDRFADGDYIPFDRTPFYQRMSSLETEFRQAAGLTGKIKMTIAQMIVRGFEEGLL